jgi:hypothetical protein
MYRCSLVALWIFIIGVSATAGQPRRATVRPAAKPTPAKVKETPPPKPPPDPITGDWNAVYQYQDLRIPFKLNLRHDNGTVSGEVTDDNGARRITVGTWSTGQLALTVENPRDPARPRLMNATLSDTRLVGTFGAGSDTTWEAERFADQLARVTSKQLPDTAARLKSELEKLLSVKLSLQMEGAYNLGEMREKATPAVPFLLETFRQTGGVKEVEADALKFLDSGGAALVSGQKVMTVYPVQNVAVGALAKIGESAIEPIRNTVLKDDPSKVSFAFGVDALARMQHPKATQLIHGLARTSDVQGRRRILDSLGTNKDPASIDLLIESLSDPISVIRESAARSLKRITGQNFGQDAVKWKEWWAVNKSKN